MRSRNIKSAKSRQSGAIVVSILIVMLFLSSLVTGLIVLANANLSRAKSRVYLLQAQYAAESGADSSVAVLNSGNTGYTGSGAEVTILSNSRYRSTYTTTVTDGGSGKEKVIIAIGKVYAPSSSLNPVASRTIEVTAQRTSTTTTSSIVSRNVLYVESGVKNIKAKDVYINGFVQMAKNTTNLVAENITVVDKYTAASNCSIGGSGNLVKPSTFTTTGQTKTKITTGYNICINPPGNTSNSNFDILANQSNLTKIQSTLIPWSQQMDGSYQASQTGCNDLTTGTSPRDLPRTGSEKRTHYPNTSSGVATSCGSNGDIAMGNNQYNIKDHLHIRANLCSSSACSPIFNNPSSDMKFVFVEGAVNFESVRTVSSSGPIAFIIYGADPASKVSSCPFGGAAYIGQGSPSSYTNAPDLYLLASNGVCLDKTKFGANPALGGISGKNIFVATSSGTPFDLGLDPLFPTEEIPIDLAWRAVRYQRR